MTTVAEVLMQVHAQRASQVTITELHRTPAGNAPQAPPHDDHGQCVATGPDGSGVTVSSSLASELVAAGAKDHR